MHNIWFALWFFLPGGIANASPVFAKRISFLHRLYKPLDFGKKFRGKAILGQNKTWLGLIFAVFIGLIVIALQKYGFENSEWLRTVSGSVNYSKNTIWLLGPLMAFGALFGDAIESFFKRQLNVASGDSWFPFDQIDYVIGGLLFSLIIVRLSIFEYLLILIIWLLMHLISSYIGYLVGPKNKPI